MVRWGYVTETIVRSRKLNVFPKFDVRGNCFKNRTGKIFGSLFFGWTAIKQVAMVED